MNFNKERKKVLYSATALLFLSGMYYMWSVIAGGLVNNLNWTSKQASMPYTIYSIGYVIAMSVFGRMQDIRGPKFVIILGTILMGLGLIFAGLILNPLALLITAGILVGLGVGAINAASLPAALRWYPKEMSGYVSGIVVAGTGASALFYSPLGDYLINNYKISTTFYVIGALSLISCLILANNIKTPDIEINKSDEEYLNTYQYNWKEMLKDPIYYKLWFMYAFSSASGLMIISHASNIALKQVGWEGGFFLVIILALFNTAGRFIGGIISDKKGRLRFFRVIIAIVAINMILFLKYSEISTLIIGCLIAGFCYGSNFSVFPSIIVNRYGEKNYGLNYGIMYTAWGVGGIIGPMLAAYFFDKSGNYFSAYKIAAVLMMVSLVVSLTFKEEDPVKSLDIGILNSIVKE